MYKHIRAYAYAYRIHVHAHAHVHKHARVHALVLAFMCAWASHIHGHHAIANIIITLDIYTHGVHPHKHIISIDIGFGMEQKHTLNRWDNHKHTSTSGH